MYFEVRDTGIGIKEKDLPKLCEAFERIEVSRNRNIEGTGLGMSIVSDLLHLMGSQLQVHSVYGKGSTFSFELAQPRISEEKIGDYEQRIRYMHQGEHYRCKFLAPDANILVVDDNDTNRMVFCNLLKQTKMQIKEVDCGAACLEAVQKEHFDLIFLDHMMPEMDGVETLQRMRCLPDNLCVQTPVVALTANAVTGAKEKYLELELPEIEGIDWNYAHIYIQDDEILLLTLKNIYRSMESDLIQLTQLYQNIYNEEGMAAYRVKVHALKNTNASVGAIMVSQLAKLLEQKAIGQEVSAIELLHPVLVEQMKSLQAALQVYYGREADEQQSQASEEFLEQQLQELIEALQSYDYDRADAITEAIDGCDWRAELKEGLKTLREQEFQLDFDACAETAVQMLAIIHSERG